MDYFGVNFRAMLRPAQSRAARALLGIRQVDLAQLAGVQPMTLKRFESGQTDPRASVRDRIERAIEAAGVELVDDPATGAFGVILRK